MDNTANTYILYNFWLPRNKERSSNSLTPLIPFSTLFTTLVIVIPVGYVSAVAISFVSQGIDQPSWF